MIALGFDSVEELAEAMYLTQHTAAALIAGQVPRGGLWLDAPSGEREIMLLAAARLLALWSGGARTR